MIISYYNGYLDIEKIRELIKIGPNGTTAYHIIEGAKKIGFEANGVKCQIDDINEDNIVLPCIANVIINNTYRHFVVIYKIDFLKNNLLIADPSNKIIKMSFDIFKSIFSGVIIMLYPNDNIPYEPHKNININLLIHIAKSHPKLIKQISILSIFITLLTICSSFFLENINNAIVHYQSQKIVILIVLMFLTFSFIKHLSTFFRQKILVLINEKINLELTLDTFRKILLLPYKNYRSKTTGDIITRILDVSLVKDNICKIFLILIIDLPLAISSLFILFMINSKLCTLAIFLLLFYIIIILMFKDLFDDHIKTIKQNNVSTTNYMIEAVNNFETVKGLKVVNNVYQHFEKKFVVFLQSTFKYDNLLILQNFLKDIISDCGLIIIYGIGAILVLNNQINFGNLLTFTSLLGYFFEPIKNLLFLEKNFRELNLILKRISELNISSDNQGLTENLYYGTVRFCHLNYTYDDKKQILDNISLQINNGEKVLFLGPSGSGKSTLFKILMKYYDVKRGMIYINDIDINDYTLAKGINYISQSENLFTDSLYNNIVLYDKVNINKFLEVTKICKVDEIVGDNPLGYNMLIEENGFNLSGGERQRIVLARTIIRKFNILVIDEGLNQVDIDMERKILKNLFEYYKNKTIIVISHRMENLDLYNRKIVLSNGVLKENVSKIC